MTTFENVAKIINEKKADLSVNASDVKKCVFDLNDTDNDAQQQWLDDSTDDEVANWCLPILEAQAQQSE